MNTARSLVESDKIGQVFTRAMTRKGFTQERLAREIEARTGHRPAQSTVSNWARGEKVPSTKLLPVVLNALGLSWADIGADIGVAMSDSQRSETQGVLASEEAAPEVGRAAKPQARPPTGPEPDLSDLDLVLIPRLARASAGDGYENGDDPKVEGYQAYPLAEIRRLTYTSPDRLRAIKAIGDSMEPEILSGSTVIYVPTEEVAEHGLYVFAIDEALLIKKIQLYSGGALEIIPINPAYSREMLLPVPDADEPNTYRSAQTGLISQFRVVGRVVFYTKVV